MGGSQSTRESPSPALPQIAALENGPCPPKASFTVPDLATLQKVSEALKRSPGVRSLALVASTLGSEGAPLLAEGLAASRGLTALRLTYPKLGQEGCKALSDALRVHPSLTDLDLRVNFESRGLQDLCEALQANASITTLSLLLCGAHGNEHLAALLRVSSSLTRLSLESTGTEQQRLGPDGARHLADALASNSSLRSISLRRDWRASAMMVQDILRAP